LKKFWRLLGWVFLGIFLQFKFNILYGIVFLENLNFHDRTYLVEMKMISTEESLRILKVKTTVHHSLGPDYFSNIYIPKNYRILNEAPNDGAEVLPGYIAYKINMQRKYRDVLGEMHFIIKPQDINVDVPLKPIKVYFENLKQRLHLDETYQISTLNHKTNLEGLEVSEFTYPQKLGM
jgi:hypothetical protein